MAYLICDSGATKADWCLVHNNKTLSIQTAGISPYFLTSTEIKDLILKGGAAQFKQIEEIAQVYYYGTGISNQQNQQILQQALQQVFVKATNIEVQHDLLAAARGLCGKEAGIACILGTGSNSCYYDGNEVQKNSPGLGYVLGDEGSGAYLGKKVLQYYLYQTFDEELEAAFEKTFAVNKDEILNKVYREPLANRYLASFVMFLVENRGHYMVENIIEDGLNDFFFTHLHKYSETWTTSVHFTGSVAFGFKDVLADLCNSYQMTLGNVFKTPMEGLLQYHAQSSFN